MKFIPLVALPMATLPLAGKGFFLKPETRVQIIIRESAQVNRTRRCRPLGYQLCNDIMMPAKEMSL
jgi:hypothetical protein